MAWMVRSRPPRNNPRELLQSAKSVITLGMDYSHPRPPDPGGLTGKVSRYAWGRDYHNLISKSLRRLCRTIQEEYPSFEAYYGVDSRPFIERAWAEKSGLGFIGKNNMIIAPGDSSYFFLAMILTNLDLDPDPRIIKDHCGSCTRCLDICPTDAFHKAGQLDARKCISYLTIEHKGSIPTHLRPLVGRWLFGCDDCQTVCPHNHSPSMSEQHDFKPRPNHAWVDLSWLLTTSDQIVSDFFIGTPLRRAGPIRLKRNAAIVMGNLRNPEAEPSLSIASKHHHPLVREHADWALKMLRA